MVFPRGRLVSPWGKLGEMPGENQPERKSKVGACVFVIATPGKTLVFHQGKAGMPSFPWGFPWGKPVFQGYVNSGILDFGRPGFWVG